MKLSVESKLPGNNTTASLFNMRRAISVPHSTLRTCMSCVHKSNCLARGLEPSEVELFSASVKHSRRLSRGEHLYRMWDPFKSIFTVLSGCVKVYRLDEEGREQIVGFYLPGDLVSIDAIGTATNPSSAVALDTTFVCEIPYHIFESRYTQTPNLQFGLISLISKSVRNEQQHAIQLRKKSADQRLAMFLVDLSQRLKARNHAFDEFNLSMSRSDIGNYLGLAMETVSRTFTHFQDLGFIAVNRKRITIHDVNRLQSLAMDTNDFGNDETLPVFNRKPTTSFIPALRPSKSDQVAMQ